MCRYFLNFLIPKITAVFILDNQAKTLENIGLNYSKGTKTIL